ncbi:MAG: c-type cytochrome [Oleispira sp.]|jgi:cytochrome c5
MKKIAFLAALVAATSFNANAFDVDTKYKQTCSICHSMGIAGAPKAFDEAAWAPRMATGMDLMVASVSNGKGAMPPKGLCNDCTPDQYKALITHMATSK